MPAHPIFVKKALRSLVVIRNAFVDVSKLLNAIY